MSYDDVPTIREVLSDDDKVANIYCAIKWTVWQIAHVIIAIFAGILIITMAILGICLLPLFVLIDWADDIYSESETAQETVRAVKTSTSGVTEKPVARRVYNECPVKLKQSPKWLQKLDDWFEEITR